MEKSRVSWDAVQLLEVVDDTKLGSNYRVHSDAGGALNLIHRAWFVRIQKGDADCLGMPSGEAKWNGRVLLREPGGQQGNYLGMNRVEVPLLGRRHALLPRERQGERFQLDCAELDEISPETAAVGLLQPQRFIPLDRRDEPVINQHVAESTRQDRHYGPDAAG
jgi:hypothetical protein